VAGLMCEIAQYSTLYRQAARWLRSAGRAW